MNAGFELQGDIFKFVTVVNAVARIMTGQHHGVNHFICCENYAIDGQATPETIFKNNPLWMVSGHFCPDIVPRKKSAYA